MPASRRVTIQPSRSTYRSEPSVRAAATPAHPRRPQRAVAAARRARGPAGRGSPERGPVARWHMRSPLPASVSASRSASATIVSVGLAYPPLGNTDDPATKRFSYPCTRQSPSTTDDDTAGRPCASSRACVPGPSVLVDPIVVHAHAAPPEADQRLAEDTERVLDVLEVARIDHAARRRTMQPPSVALRGQHDAVRRRRQHLGVHGDVVVEVRPTATAVAGTAPCRGRRSSSCIAGAPIQAVLNRRTRGPRRWRACPCPCCLPASRCRAPRPSRTRPQSRTRDAPSETARPRRSRCRPARRRPRAAAAAAARCPSPPAATTTDWPGASVNGRRRSEQVIDVLDRA